jgi:hypothetical protein
MSEILRENESNLEEEKKIRMENILITQRVGTGRRVPNDSDYGELLRAIERNPGSCDEVWFSTARMFPTFERHRACAERIAEEAKKFRRLGVKASLELCASVGHGVFAAPWDYSGLVFAGSSAQYMVGADGVVSEQSFCWRDSYLREYLRETLKIYAVALKPHSLFLDDDLRPAGHAPVDLGCFCDGCIEKFNRRANIDFDRAGLVWEINYGDVKRREAFIDFMRDGLRDLTLALSRAVMEASPNTVLGFENMLCSVAKDHTWAFDAMREAADRPPRYRPGGGNYTENGLGSLLEKYIGMCCDMRLLPEDVTQTTAELESYPNVTYGKSVAATLAEGTLYMAAGISGVSMTEFRRTLNPTGLIENTLIPELARVRPYWQRLYEYSAESRPAGLEYVLPKFAYKIPADEGEPLFHWSRLPVNGAAPLLVCGIPIAYSGDCPVRLLHEDAAELLTDEEISALLSRSVVTSAKAIEILARRGYGERLPIAVKAVDLPYSPYLERFERHPVNEGFAGRLWEPAFFSLPRGVVSVYELFPKDGAPFETTSSYAPASLGCPNASGVASAIVTAAEGGSWAVFGVYPWQSVINGDKQRQFANCADYISGDAMPAIIETPCRALLLPRANGEGQTVCATVMNCSMGRCEGIVLRVRRAAGSKAFYLSQGNPSERLALRITAVGDDTLVALPPIDAYRLGTVFFEEV